MFDLLLLLLFIRIFIIYTTFLQVNLNNKIITNENGCNEKGG